MTPIIKNFSGTFENGKRYRIKFENEYIKSLKSHHLFIYVEEFQEEIKGIIEGVWLFNHELRISGFYKKGGYSECMENCLLELEKKINVQLIKTATQCDILGGVNATGSGLLKN